MEVQLLLAPPIPEGREAERCTPSRSISVVLCEVGGPPPRPTHRSVKSEALLQDPLTAQD